MRKIILFSLVLGLLCLSNYQPVTAQEDDKPICGPFENEDSGAEPEIHPGKNLILQQGDDSENYQTAFAVLTTNPITKPQFLKNDLILQISKGSHENYHSISAKYISIDQSVNDGTADEYFKKFNVSVSLPPDVPYPKGKYEGALLLFHNKDQDPIRLNLCMYYIPKPVVDIVPTPIHLNDMVPVFPNSFASRLFDYTVEYPLVLHETTGAIDAKKIELAGPVVHSIMDDTVFLPRDIISKTDQITIPMGGMEDLTLNFNFNVKGVKPGDFRGSLFLSGENIPIMEIPVELTLKHSWGLPTVALGVGILAGLVLNFYTIIRQERDRLLTQIHRERDNLERALLLDELSPFYELYRDAVKENLTLAEEGLKKDDPKIEIAKQYLGQIETFKALYTRERHGLFTNLLNLKRKIGQFLEDKSEVFETYTYTKQFEDSLKSAQEKLAACQNQEAYKEIEEAFTAEQNKIKIYLETLDKINKLSKRLPEGLDISNQEEINKLKDRINVESQKLQNATDATTTKDIQKIINSLNEIGEEISKAIPSEQLSENGEQHTGDDFDTWDPPPINWRRDSDLNKIPSVGRLERFRRYTPSLRWYTYRLGLALVTVLVLGYLGISELYLGDPTFGDNGLSDYLNLVIWGLGANVTQEGIFQLIGNLGARLQPVRSQPTNSGTISN